MTIMSLRSEHVTRSLPKGHEKASFFCGFDATMCSRLLCCVALCLLGAAGISDAEVIQTPSHLVKGKGQKAKMDCLPQKGHTAVYWYQQIQNEEFKFLIYFQNEDILDQIELVKKRFSANCSQNSQNSQNLHCSLEIRSSEPGDSALYFCASSPPRGGDYTFGAGTRLTVVDDLSKVNPPKVTVFEPSEAEIARTQKATLVCLATGFYPDHVELSWWVNGKKVQSGVSTDPQAYKEQPSQSDSRYRLSSRLRVSATFWHNPRNRFRCQVEFHGISDEDARSPGDSERVTQNVSAETRGKADCGFTAKSYQQGLLSATILYEILLGKATLYAVLVSALVLMAMVKRKDS